MIWSSSSNLITAWLFTQRQENEQIGKRELMLAIAQWGTEFNFWNVDIIKPILQDEEFLQSS